MLSNKTYWVIVLIITCKFVALDAASFSRKENTRKNSHQEKAIKSRLQGPYCINIPKGWDCIEDKSQLPATVELVLIGSGKGQFTPSLNLATETTEFSLEEYFTLAQKYHEGQPDTRCRRLGKIDTEEGVAELLQIDKKSQWGDVRFIQAAMVKNNIAYVITATCLLQDFSSLSNIFLDAIKSFKLVDSKGELCKE